VQEQKERHFVSSGLQLGCHFVGEDAANA
jgi:hypothetical protein